MKRKRTTIKISGILLGTLVLVAGLPGSDGIHTTTPTIREKSRNTQGNTLYVGGNGTGNYTTIQDAIDNASDGDSIFVFNGIYYENILIYKSLNLYGENAESTIIDGRELKEVVKIIADLATITQFTIQNSSHDLPFNAEPGIVIESNCNHIANTILVDNYIGILLKQALHNTISQNSISESSIGIWCVLASRNTITKNIIQKNGGGIHLQEDSSINTIESNIIQQNSYGIRITGCRNHVRHNNIRSNDNGILISDQSSNTIELNSITNNSNIGISIEISQSNVITKNTIQGNDLGIRITWGQNNQINQNTFSENRIPARFSLLAPSRFLKIFVRNTWEGNYWDDHHTNLPKIIIGDLSYYSNPTPPGHLVTIPWITMDWNPMQHPNTIQLK